jgi:hypothetical protein
LGHVGTQRFVPGLSSHDNELTDNIYFNTFNSVIGDDTVTYAHISTAPKLISGDANKVSYFTPRIVGLQFGGSFAPNNENANGSESNSGSINKQEDIFEMSLSYKGKTEKSGPMSLVFRAFAPVIWQVVRTLKATRSPPICLIKIGMSVIAKPILRT